MKKQRSIRVFTEIQRWQFLAALSQNQKTWRDYFFFDLLFNTGLRLSEAVHLDVGDVYNGSYALNVLDIIGKGGKAASIPINNYLKNRIIEYIGQKQKHMESIDIKAPLFTSRNHKRVNPRTIQMNFKKWIRSCGLDTHLTVHSCRHYVGTSLMRKTNNIRKVQEFLRHSDISSTQIYTHVSKEELLACAEELSC